MDGFPETSAKCKQTDSSIETFRALNCLTVTCLLSGGGGQGETALHAAAYGGHSAAVMALIADGANVNARSVSLVLSCTALRQKSLESVCIAIAREQFENGWDLFNLV